MKPRENEHPQICKGERAPAENPLPLIIVIEK
jgi:hypothetical protein